MNKMCLRLVPKISLLFKNLSKYLSQYPKKHCEVDHTFFERVIAYENRVFFLHTTLKPSAIPYIGEVLAYPGKSSMINKSKFKVMMVMFFIIWGVIHIEWALDNQFVNRTKKLRCFFVSLEFLCWYIDPTCLTSFCMTFLFCKVRAHWNEFVSNLWMHWRKSEGWRSFQKTICSIDFMTDFLKK